MSREMRAVVAFVVLAQDIFAVVVAVGCPHDGVGVKRFGLVVVEEDPAVIIEFYEYHRTLEPIVERPIAVVATDPREPGVG